MHILKQVQAPMQFPKPSGLQFGYRIGNVRKAAHGASKRNQFSRTGSADRDFRQQSFNIEDSFERFANRFNGYGRTAEFSNRVVPAFNLRRMDRWAYHPRA